MIKQIKRPADNKLDIITRSLFEPLSEAELKLLRVLVDFSTGNAVTLTGELSKQIVSSAGISQSSFGTSLHRLEKKGVISSAGKTKNLHPVFNNIQNCEGLLIKFHKD